MALATIPLNVSWTDTCDAKAFCAAARAETGTSAQRIQAKTRGNLRTMRAIEDFRARDDDALNISAIKAGLRICGWDFGPTRPPQRRLTEAEEAELGRLLAPILAVEKQR